MQDEPIHGYSVHHETLRTGSHALGTSSDTLYDAVGTHAAGTTSGAEAHPALAISQAVARVAGPWATHLRGHADRISAHSGSLMTNVTAYEEAEGATRDGAAHVPTTTTTVEV